MFSSLPFLFRETHNSLSERVSPDTLWEACTHGPSLHRGASPATFGAATEAERRRAEGKEPPALVFVFANRDGQSYLGTSINHLHRNVCAPKVDGKRKAIFPADFVLHSLRHTMLTRLGESGVDAFTIMRIAGHSSITVSQRYIHPTPEAVERAFERLQLSGARPENQPKRLPPATISATLGGPVAVTH
ncbi:MAG: tyrosine-type recombinase/integrase [Acidobacteriota bacterium]